MVGLGGMGGDVNGREGELDIGLWVYVGGMGGGMLFGGKVGDG